MAAAPLNPTMFVLLLAIVISTLASPVLGLTPETQALIDKICRGTEDYGFCNKIFHDNIHAEGTDLRGLADIAVSKAAEKSAEIYVYASHLYNIEKDPRYKKYLKDCSAAYGQIQFSYQMAIGYLVNNAYKDFFEEVRKDPKAEAPCEGYGGTHALTERNRVMRILIAMNVNAGFDLSKS